MKVWEYIFYFSCFVIFYNYAGYAIIVYCYNALTKALKGQTDELSDFFPAVSFIVAAYNEEEFIDEKIINSVGQNYPSERIEFIFVTDGSTDSTPQKILQYPELRLMHKAERDGKSAAINRAVTEAHGEILIFSDANAILNTDATLIMARHYQNKKVGGVAGEKKIIHSTNKEDGISETEGLYWKYESILKQLDSDFYSVVGAAGELFSIRKELYSPLHKNIILDDFVISLKAAQKGFRIKYEPKAYAVELPSFSLQDEQKRKVRIAAGGFQAMILLASLLFFWKHLRLSFLYISHRVLRWTLSPICFILALISNTVLVFLSKDYIFLSLFIIQVLFYFSAILSKFVSLNKPYLKVFKLPYYFVFMNVSVIRGFFRFLQGKQPATWEKAKRQPSLFTKK